MSGQKPHRCPVCRGMGTIPLYSCDWAHAEGKLVACHSCGGKGVVWTPEAVAAATEKPPRRLDY